MNYNLLYKWKNSIYTNKHIINIKCQQCNLCSRYLFLIEESIIDDNCLGIDFIDNHIHINNKVFNILAKNEIKKHTINTYYESDLKYINKFKTLLLKN